MQLTLNAYIQKCQTLDEVRHGLVIPVFAQDHERMETSGFKRIGSARVMLELDSEQEEDRTDAILAAARMAGAGDAS